MYEEKINSKRNCLRGHVHGIGSSRGFYSGSGAGNGLFHPAVFICASCRNGLGF